MNLSSRGVVSIRADQFSCPKVGIRLPWWFSGQESACQYRRWGFSPWVFWEDPLKKEMATQSSILAWEIPWTKEPGHSVARAAYDLATKQQQSRYQVTLLLEVRSNSVSKTGKLRLKRKTVVYILGKFYHASSTELHSTLKSRMLGTENLFLLFVCLFSVTVHKAHCEFWSHSLCSIWVAVTDAVDIVSQKVILDTVYLIIKVKLQPFVYSPFFHSSKLRETKQKSVSAGAKTARSFDMVNIK